MPHAPYWWRRHAEIRAVVAALGEEWIDRRSVEEIFGVSPRESLRILRRAGARVAGGALMVPAREMAAWLDRLEREKSFQAEQDRLDRLSRKVHEARRLAAGRKIVIREPEAGLVRLKNLPETIRLRSGKLEIVFTDAEDLLRQLRLLGLCMMDDWDRVAGLLAPSPRRPEENLTNQER